MIKLTPESEAALCEWAASRPAVAELWHLHPENDGDFAIHLLPKAEPFDWPWGDCVMLSQAWTDELCAIVGESVQMAAFRGRIGSIDIADVATLIWRRA